MIRKATIDDRPALFELAAELATSSVVTAEGFNESFEKILQMEHMCLSVAEEEGRIVGYVLGTYHPCFYASSNVAWTAELFVVPDRRSEGIGKALMEAIENWGRGKGCSLNTLATRRAGDFYSALDYEKSADYFKKSLNGG